MMPNHEKKGDCYVNPCFIAIKRRTSILKFVIRVAFLMKSKHQYINPNEENVFIMPNLEMNRDYYVNPRLSQFKDELQFWNW